MICNCTLINLFKNSPSFSQNESHCFFVGLFSVSYSLFLLCLLFFLFLFFALLINIATVQHCNFVLIDFTLEVDNVLIGYLGIFFPSHRFLVFIYLFIHFLVFKTACLFVLSLQFTFISVELP